MKGERARAGKSGRLGEDTPLLLSMTPARAPERRVVVVAGKY